MPLDLREQNRELLSKLLESQTHLKKSMSSKHTSMSSNKKVSSQDARQKMISRGRTLNQNIVREDLQQGENKAGVTRSSTPKLLLYQPVGQPLSSHHHHGHHQYQTEENNVNEDTLNSITSLNTAVSDVNFLDSFERKLESSANVRTNRLGSKPADIHNIERINAKSDRQSIILQFPSKTLATLQQSSRNKSSPEKRNKENLLGYDWIAEMLEANDSFETRPDEYFEELNKFRQTHHVDCFGTASEDDVNLEQIPRMPYEDWPPPSYTSKAHLDKLKEDMEHRCVHLYRMNTRGFAIPVNVDDHGQSVCPVCKKKRELDSKTMVRITVPKKMLPEFDRIDNSWEQREVFPSSLRSSKTVSGVTDNTPAGDYRPGDSMGLSKHVVAGWQSARPTCTAPATFVDIKSAASHQ